MNKTRKRSFTVLLFVLASLLVLTLSLGIFSACGGDANDENGTGASTEESNATWYYGDAEPAEGLGKTGDYYLNTETLASYVKDGDEWKTVAADKAGSWYYGTEAPQSTVGDVNDFYLDTKTGKLYHKTAEGWGSPILVLKGNEGRDGVVWFSGEIDPNTYPEGDLTLKDAKAGDFYLDYSEFEVYQRQADGAWNSLGSLKGEDGKTPELPEAEKVTVTYDVNGGAALAESSVQVPKGDSIAALPVPTRKNYTFLGWFTGTGVNDGQVTTVTPISRDMTLVAHWVFSGRYTFDDFKTDGASVSATEGAIIYTGTTHTFDFFAHGADDSFLQVWYRKDGVDGEALWNKAVGGTVYTTGLVGGVELKEHGEMSLRIANASFTETGTYYIRMESDGHLSAQYKIVVKDRPSAPSASEPTILDGAIESPTETKPLGIGDSNSYNFLIAHDVLSSAAKASLSDAGTGKVRLILGMNLTFDSYSSASFTEDDETIGSAYYDFDGNKLNYYFGKVRLYDQDGNNDDHVNPNCYPKENSLYDECLGTGLNEGQHIHIWDEEMGLFVDQITREPCTVNGGKDIHVKPFQYVYTYGEKFPQGFTSYSRTLKVDGFVGITRFEVYEQAVEFTLEVSLTSAKYSLDVPTVKIAPTLVYEYEAEDGTVTRYDVIGNKKLEEGEAKTQLVFETCKSSNIVQPDEDSISAYYLNGIAPNSIKLAWEGEPEDFEFVGVYVHDAELPQNEVYKDDEFSLAYRYEGVTEEDGKQKAVFDFYYYVAHKSMILYSGHDEILRIDYRYKGVEYSQYISIYAHGNDLNDVATMGRAMLEGWHAMLEAYEGSADPKGYLARVHEIIDPLYENRDHISPETYQEVFMAAASGSKVTEMNLAAIIAKPDTPFDTTSAEHFNAVAAEMTGRLLAKYEGVSRATFTQWYRKNFYDQTKYIYSSPYQSNAVYSYFYALFFGAASNSFNYNVWSYTSDYIFGSVEIYAGFVEEIFNLCAPAEVSMLLDDIWATHTTSVDDIDSAAIAAFGAAFEAYHADPSDDTLQAYIAAANNYSAAVNRNEKTETGNRTNELDLLNKVWSDYAKDTVPNSDPATAELYEALRKANTAANTAKTKLTAETLGDYARALEAYAAAMEEYSIARNGFDLIGYLTSTWEELESKKSAGTLTEVQNVLYDAYQTIRKEGLADGAQPDKVLSLSQKTKIIMETAVSNPESYDVHMDIYTWLNNRTTFSMDNLRKLSPLLLAYDAHANSYAWNTRFSDNVLTVQQFAHAYKVLYTDGAARGSAEYMELLETLLATAHPAIDLGDDATKAGIKSVLALYLNLPVREKLEKAYKANPSDEEAKNAYLDYIDGVLAADVYSALNNRFNNNANGYTKSEVTGVERSTLMDKFVKYFDEGDASYLTDLIKARKDDHEAATDYDTFVSEHPEYQGWHSRTLVNFHISSIIESSLLNLKDDEGHYVFTTDGQAPAADKSNVKQYDEGLRAIYEQYVATMGKEDATSVKNHKILASNLFMALNYYLMYTVQNGKNWTSLPAGVR